MKRLTSLTGFTAAVALTGLLAAACATSGARSLGPGPTGASPTPTITQSGPSPSPTSSLARLFTFQIWLAKDGKLFETKRTEPFNVAVGKLALDTLQKGPTDLETSTVGLSTTIPKGTTLTITSLADGTATVQASPSLAHQTPKAQVVFTLTQYANIQRVRFAGDPATYTRRSMEWALPPIAVDSPSIGQQVSSPVRVSGTANVFEGTVNVRILDANGHELARAFTTATCGTGCRGDYSVSVRFHVDHQQPGTVEVLDYSAKDGTPENVVSIPVILAP